MAGDPLRAVPARVRAIIESTDVHYELLRHKRVRTNEEMARALGVPLGATIKSVLLAKADGRAVQVLLPGHRHLDGGNFSRSVGLGGAQAIPKDTVEELVGYPPGAIPPFGHSTTLPTYMSAELTRRRVVYVTSGNLSVSIRLVSADLARLVEARVFRGCLK